MLFDICSIYSQSYKNELEVMFKELFSYEKLYNDNLKNSIQYTIKVSYKNYQFYCAYSLSGALITNLFLVFKSVSR